jgi:hypothetical protein
MIQSTECAEQRVLHEIVGIAQPAAARGKRWWAHRLRTGK